MTTDPTALAREVLEAQAAFDRDAEDAAHYGEVCDRLNEVVDRAAPALARAVIELTARLDAERFAHANTGVKVKNVEALVGRLFDAEADPMVSRGGVFISRLVAAHLIRAALNGDRT